MRIAAPLLFFLVLGPFAQAQFKTTSSVTVIPRQGMASHLNFVGGGSRVIQVGHREPSRIFDLNDMSTYLLMTGQNFDYPISFTEKRQTQEIFYIGEQSDGTTTVRRYLKGFSLANGSAQSTYSNSLYKGWAYLSDFYTQALSLDENKLYFAKIGTNEVFELNLQTYTVDTSYIIPEIYDGKLQTIREIKLNGATVLVADIKDSDSLSTLLFFDPATGKNVRTVKADTFGLGTGRNYTVLRNTEFSSDGRQALLCGKVKCVVYNIADQRSSADWAMDGGRLSSAQFSPDGRYVFVAEGKLSQEQFFVVEAATGLVVLAPKPIRTASALKAFQASSSNSYVILLKDRLLHLSNLDGKILNEHILSAKDVSFDDMAFLDEVQDALHFVTSKDTGEINRWTLSL